ncbi:hypothetical protein RFI_20194 [Reticulomyxa filosa]|uniref:Uncharacterized protein n=1 Tax=Reticulomyxa filosa TaxID=46433 RepID=X6MTF7_RETFI|nr:hypothetical protein RFI_20194 [Reticulomyxa filosa]|eukprot:ETO17139.1 hypothetical protein RFI_20194 [Reticulomyxa filosa]
MIIKKMKWELYLKKFRNKQYIISYGKRNNKENVFKECKRINITHSVDYLIQTKIKSIINNSKLFVLIIQFMFSVSATTFNTFDNLFKNNNINSFKFNYVCQNVFFCKRSIKKNFLRLEDDEIWIFSFAFDQYPIATLPKEDTLKQYHQMSKRMEKICLYTSKSINRVGKTKRNNKTKKMNERGKESKI